jgi:hypothetical protein
MANLASKSSMGGFAMRYCQLCKRVVEPVKPKFNWALFLLTIWLFGAGLIYLLWYLICVPKNRCPICGTRKLLTPDRAAAEEVRQS